MKIFIPGRELWLWAFESTLPVRRSLSPAGRRARRSPQGGSGRPGAGRGFPRGTARAGVRPAALGQTVFSLSFVFLALNFILVLL